MDITGIFGKISEDGFGHGLLSPFGLILGGGILLAAFLLLWLLRNKSVRSRGENGSSRNRECSNSELLDKLQRVTERMENQKKELEVLLNRCTEGVATLSTILTAFENTFNRSGKAVCPEKSIPGIFGDLESSLNHEVQSVRDTVQAVVPTGLAVNQKVAKTSVSSSVREPSEAVRLDPPNHGAQATRRAVRLLLREGNSTEEIAKKLHLPLEEAELIVKVLSKNWNAA